MIYLLSDIIFTSHGSHEERRMHVIKGMDVSFTRELEDLGAEYFLNGEKKDVFEILRECGTDLIRLRLWMNPYDEDMRPYGGGMNDIATTIDLARRARKHQMNI
jgi:arabinogalactan endo-1,4-beta-galactosidase